MQIKVDTNTKKINISYNLRTLQVMKRKLHLRFIRNFNDLKYRFISPII